jgi:hypothetical protein
MALEKAARRRARSYRAEDIRRKLELGMIVVEAGLGDVDEGFLFGALIEAATIRRDSPEFERLKAIGTRAHDRNPA